jgi:murein DD-endopeptidase MepM/ murein hydrolase activator NlpD
VQVTGPQYAPMDGCRNHSSARSRSSRISAPKAGSQLLFLGSTACCSSEVRRCARSEHRPGTAAAGKLSHLVRGGAIRPDISPDAHRGVDYRVPVGTLVLAVLSGVVYQAGWGGEAGLRVGIRHPGGLHSRYLHLSAVWLEVGQVVAAGTVVGLSGNTGRSTGPHLHVEVFRDFIRTLDSGGGGRGSSTCMPMPGTTRSRGRIPWGCRRARCMSRGG